MVSETAPRYCVQCGNGLSPQARFCTLCGYELPETSPKPTKTPKPPKTKVDLKSVTFSKPKKGAEYRAPKVQSVPASKVASKYCIKCGSEIESDSRFCVNCGDEIVRDRKTQAPQRRPSPSFTRPVESSGTDRARNERVEYAEFFPRLIAWFLDLIIIGIIGAVLGFSIGLGPHPVFMNVITFFIGWMYFFVLETYNDGQTLGKMAFHLRTVDKDTLELAETDKYLINSLTKGSVPLLIVDIILGLIINSGSSDKRLRFSQNLANTVVIKDKS